MPLKSVKNGFSIQGFDLSHIVQTEEYVSAVDGIYNTAVDEFSHMASLLKIDTSKPFSFSDYPGANAKAETIVKKLSGNMKSVITKGSTDQWLYACKKNDEFIESILTTSKVPKKLLEKYQDKNLDALKTFQSRKVDGMDLSDRIWNYSDQMKKQMELGIDIAIGDGKSAQSLSRELKKYLVDPDKLFKRVKDKHGNLVLSKNAKAFHPGQGKYRSSHKNALRLTRSEINMAYKISDQMRWDSLDFVVGYEVRLSNNHTLNGEPFYDICNELAGKYPKSFKFTGWHPQCRCLVIPILMDRDEFNTDELNELKAALNGTEYSKYESRNAVTDVPQSFKKWVDDNKERSKMWASKPYFVRDNFFGGSLEGGLKLPQNVVKVNNAIEMPSLLLKVEQKYDFIKNIDISKQISAEIDKSQTNIESLSKQIDTYKSQIKDLSNNLDFDKYVKNFKPGETIPKTIERESGTFELFNAQKDMYSPKMVAEYRKYKSSSASETVLKNSISKYEEKLIAEKERLSKLQSGQLNDEISKELTKKLKNDRADEIFYKYASDDKLIRDTAKQLKDELNATNSFSAKSTNTEYIETKYGKIRISDHDSRFEQDSALGSKASQNRPVEFDIEDHNILFTKDKNGFIVKINDKEYYVHEYNIKSREDLIEFAKTKLKRQINDIDKTGTTISDLQNIYSFDEETAIEYLSAKTPQEKQMIDIIRISKIDDFAGKVAKTIIDNNFKSISPKQADILFKYSVEQIDITDNYLRKIQDYLDNAKYRQAGSSLRK